MRDPHRGPNRPTQPVSTPRMVQVYPPEDWIEHMMFVGCPCGPTVTREGRTLLVVHRAVDGRR